ncbi:MAG: acetyl-CoA carboxylase, carboxyltransferase subunit beta [Spirochaetales bacterium]|nr:acetyl-CoA carboxylase, carboxyltransferase subunit beta [Spirochaetales bacterium]
MALFSNLLGRMFSGKKPAPTQVVPLKDERTFVAQKHSCPACHTHLDEGELERNLFVCPQCSHHFRITPVERIKFLSDPGTFQEFSSEVQTTNPIGFPGYEAKLNEAKAATGLADAILNGFVQIDGRKAIFSIMTFKFMGGSMGSVAGEKLTRALLTGIEKRLPVILFTTSGGMRMQEGIFSLMQMAKTSAAIAQMELSQIPLFVVLTDPTYGGVTASFAMLGDVIIAEPGASIGFAGPRVIESTIRQKLPEGFQKSEFLLQKGFIDAIVSRAELKKTLGFLIDTHMARLKVR